PAPAQLHQENLFDRSPRPPPVGHPALHGRGRVCDARALRTATTRRWLRQSGVGATRAIPRNEMGRTRLRAAQRRRPKVEERMSVSAVRDEIFGQLGLGAEEAGAFDGAWRAGGTVHGVRSPIDGSVLARVRHANAADYERVAARATQAFLHWR